MIDKIVQKLKESNQIRSEFVELMEQFNDPYLVLIGCILSLRTNDKTTYPATLRMLELAKTPEQMATEELLAEEERRENNLFRVSGTVLRVCERSRKWCLP